MIDRSVKKRSIPGEPAVLFEGLHNGRRASRFCGSGLLAAPPHADA